MGIRVLGGGGGYSAVVIFGPWGRCWRGGRQGVLDDGVGLALSLLRLWADRDVAPIDELQALHPPPGLVHHLAGALVLSTPIPRTVRTPHSDSREGFGRQDTFEPAL
jgi:hypothetical protein